VGSALNTTGTVICALPVASRSSVTTTWLSPALPPPAAEQVPPLAVQVQGPLSVTPSGRLSVTTTPVAASGPALDTVIT